MSNIQEGNEMSPPYAVDIEGPDGRCATLGRWEGPVSAARPMALTDDLRSSLSALIEPGLSVLAQGEAARGAFTVVFSPKVAEGLANGSMTLIQGEQGVYLTAIQKVARPDGSTVRQIAGNGQVVADGAKRAAHLSMAALQVMAMVTAQEFLAEIDRKLAALQEDIEAIRDWLEQSERSELRANYQYLQDIGTALRARPAAAIDAAVYLGRFEAIEQHALKVAALCEAMMQGILDSVPAEITKSLRITGAQEDIGKLDSAARKWQEHAHCYMAAQQLRMLLAELRDQLPGDPQIGAQRLAASAAAVTALAGKWQTVFALLDQRCGQVDAQFQQGLVAAIRRDFRKLLRGLDTAFASRRADVMGFHVAVERSVMEKALAQERGLALLVSTDDAGCIVELGRFDLREPMPLPAA